VGGRAGRGEWEGESAETKDRIKVRDEMLKGMAVSGKK
jgi:hypothetical protein